MIKDPAETFNHDKRDLAATLPVLMTGSAIPPLLPFLLATLLVSTVACTHAGTSREKRNKEKERKRKKKKEAAKKRVTPLWQKNGSLSLIERLPCTRYAYVKWRRKEGSREVAPLQSERERQRERVLPCSVQRTGERERERARRKEKARGRGEGEREAARENISASGRRERHSSPAAGRGGFRREIPSLEGMDGRTAALWATPWRGAAGVVAGGGATAAGGGLRAGLPEGWIGAAPDARTANNGIELDAETRSFVARFISRQDACVP